MHQDQPQRLLSASEAARYLGIAEETARAWGRQGRLPVVRLGRRMLFDRRALDALIDRQREHPAEAA